MANVVRIEAQIQTGAEGTDGTVYLGICGREFDLDTPNTNNFEKGGNDVFIMGVGSNMVHKDRNDPQDPQLLTEDLFSFPAWIRYEDEQDSVWEIADLTVTVNPGPAQVVFTSAVPLPFQLSGRYGQYCFLKGNRSPG
jgi:hypothetical protein